MSMTGKNNGFINLANAREGNQKKVMEEIAVDGVCPFCPENLAKYHKQPILKDGKYWLLTTNQWPYKYTKKHLLAIAKKHVTHINELSKDAVNELMEMFIEAAKEYGIGGGGIGLRFGNTDHTGATVSHLHAHLIEPEPDHPSDSPVRFKIG
jgi:ATP adenylyltransferase